MIINKRWLQLQKSTKSLQGSQPTLQPRSILLRAGVSLLLARPEYRARR